MPWVILDRDQHVKPMEEQMLQSEEVMVSRISLKIFRALLSGIFLVAGANHLLNTANTAARLEHARIKEYLDLLGNPQDLVILTGVIMLIAGSLFMIGYRTKWMAAILMIVLIPITISVQVGQLATLGPLFKNIAILGGLIFFWMNDSRSPLN